MDIEPNEAIIYHIYVIHDFRRRNGSYICEMYIPTLELAINSEAEFIATKDDQKERVLIGDRQNATKNLSRITLKEEEMEKFRKLSELLKNLKQIKEDSHLLFKELSSSNQPEKENF